MAIYINVYFENSQDISVEAKKYKLVVKMLKDKVTKGNVEVRKIINTIIKRAEDAEVALQRAMENSKIKSIQVAQAGKIKKLEASLMAIEQEMKKVESDVKSKIKAITLRAMENIQASTKFLDKKADFAFDAYGEGIQFSRDKVIA